ncbi:hypothetical protein CRUP_000912 [Coryphaenoides rupestris]|nr:hypothetical protein CRUP_000912 [Coryphaenoides rupestris]
MVTTTTGVTPTPMSINTTQQSATSSNASSSAMPTSTPWMSPNSTWGANSTMMTSMISCPMLTCNYSDCYSAYFSMNSTSCSNYCQECCLSTTTSCLALNGTLNVPSSATRGPRFRVDVIVFFLCLLVVSGL